MSFKNETEADFSASKYTVNTQEITKYFNLSIYLASGALNYKVDNLYIYSIENNSQGADQYIQVKRKKDSVYDYFLWRSKAKTFTTYDFETSRMMYYNRTGNHPYFTLYLEQAQERTNTQWTQLYIDDFLSNIGGLFTAIFKTAAFLILGYE